MVYMRAVVLLSTALFTAAIGASVEPAFAQAQKKPNVVVIMTDDVGWGDAQPYGFNRGVPTPNLNQLAAEGMRFTSWYGQASCTAGRASFMTGRIPVRSALSVVVAPGDENHLQKSQPTVAEFFKKNGYQTYYSGKWHLGDKPDAYPINHGFDEMKHFLAYYAGVYAYTDTILHPTFPRNNPEFMKMYWSVVNDGEWEGKAGETPRRVVEHFSYKDLALIDNQQAASAVEHLKAHYKDDKPMFMYVAFMKVHNPNNPAPEFAGKSHLSRYLDAFMELDNNTGKILKAIKELGIEKETIVLWTTDNGPWIDAYPDAGYTPFRAAKGSTFEGAFRVPAFIWAPGRVNPGTVNNDIIGHIDAWPTLAGLAGLTPPPHGAWTGNDGQPIYFDGIDQSARIRSYASPMVATANDNGSRVGANGGRVTTSGGEVALGGKDNASVPAPRMTWVYMRGLDLQAVRYGEWKWSWSAQDAWLGPKLDMGLPAVYNLYMDPGEQYDMAFNGAAPKVQNQIGASPGRWSGQDGGWTMALAGKVMSDVIESFKKYPNVPTIPGGASLGSDIPEFVRPTILPGKEPETNPAIKNMKLEPNQ
jgi:arylsulfatase